MVVENLHAPIADGAVRSPGWSKTMARDAPFDTNSFV
uniref:Uncharacterized protein n=1 Tax=Romanomermis culicivorax TaxID=13658 RepID=A0A915J7R8_ROMCU